MIQCKAGEWFLDNNQRAMANNSAVLDRSAITEAQFRELWAMVEASGSGEPGVYFSNDRDWGTNPCCEVALEPYQFCNLTEINASVARSQQDLNELSRAAALLGTLQASYTDFHFLRPQWRQVTEAAALLGVSMTGTGYVGCAAPLESSHALPFFACRHCQRHCHELGPCASRHTSQ